MKIAAAMLSLFKRITFILFFSGLVNAENHTEADEFKLEQLQVLFRHGDRTPTTVDIYEGDPYEEIYQSYGYGQLTRVGKKREYKIGQILRERYNKFLGEYRSGDVYAYSSDFDRTKMSLQLVLAGLYPPSPSTSWSDSVNWQPIPTHYEGRRECFLTTTYFNTEFDKLHHELTNTSEMLKRFENNKDLFQRITNNTGIKMLNLFAATKIYSNLRSALSLNLSLPVWCSKEDFQELETINAIFYKSQTQTEQLRKMMAGPIVQQFLKVFKANESSEKIYLYSGHEYNVAAFVNAHNTTGAPDFYDFGSTVIFEKLRGPDNQHYVRIFLWTGVSEKLLPLKFPNCDIRCPLSDYNKIVQPILPNEVYRLPTFCEC